MNQECVKEIIEYANNKVTELTVERDKIVIPAYVNNWRREKVNQVFGKQLNEWGKLDQDIVRWRSCAETLGKLFPEGSWSV